MPGTKGHSGGARRGGGRPKGSKNRRTTLMEILPQLAAEDRQLPLYRLLDRIADDTLDAKYRDMLCVQVLPFMHSRLSPNLSAKPPYLMTDTELDETMRAQEEHERQVKKGGAHLHLVRGPK